MQKCSKCAKNKELNLFHKNRTRKSGFQPVCKMCQSERKSNLAYGKEYRAKNVEKLREYRRKYVNKRRKEDPLYKLAESMKVRLWIALGAKKWLKTNTLKNSLGCTLEELKTHIESKFTDNMSWENRGEWHTDHIHPLSKAKTEEELLKLCHYTNIQPLWAKDNLIKSDRIGVL